MNIVSCSVLISTTIIVYLVSKFNALKENNKKDRNFFINTLTHDLRVAELARLRGIEALSKDISQNDYEELKKELHKSSQCSIDIIDMLINIYKYENNQNFLNYSEIDYSQLLFSESQHLADIAKNKQIEFTYDLISSPIIADKKILSETLHKLIEIAIFNTNQCSKIKLKTFLNRNNIITMISYNGLPISVEKYNKIYTENPGYSSVGNDIKMIMCDKNIQFHSGKICIAEKHDGTNFIIISLPVKNRLNAIAKSILTKKITNKL